MKKVPKKVRIGIVGCGAIGSRIARSVNQELKKDCALKAICDIDARKVYALSLELGEKNIAKKSYNDLLENCDLVVEAVNAQNTQGIVRQALQARKHILAMSVGKLLNGQALFKLAEKNKCKILIPSGAIAGIDAIKAASLKGINQITLITRKPPSGFASNTYFKEKGINLFDINSEKVIFEGDVNTAVKLFPQNINVAATIALACGLKDKILIRIMTSQTYTMNSHEIEVSGDFGKMVSRTDNVVCPDNPKTSYLAVLSAIQTLKQFFQEVKIGT